MERTQFKYDVFLSYGWRDQSTVRQIAERLRSDGLRVWFDDWEIRVGAHLQRTLEKGLEQSRALVFFMSADSFSSNWAQLEANTFRFRDPLNKDRRFIPVRLDSAEVPHSIEQFLYLDWRQPTEDHYQRLRDACLPPPQPASSESVNVPRKASDGSKDRTAVFGKIRAFLIAEDKLYYAGSDGYLWYSELDKDIPLKRLPVFCGRPQALARSNEALVVGGDDRLLYVIRQGDSEPRRLAGHDRPVLSLATDPNGIVYSGSADFAIIKWDIKAATSCGYLQGHTGQVRALSANKDWLVSGSSDTSVRVWDKTGKCTRVLEGHSGEVLSVALSEDGRFALSGSSDCTVRLWNIQSGFCIRVFRGHTDSVTSIAIHPNQRHVVTGSGDRTIRLWDLTSGKCLRVMDGHKTDVLALQWVSRRRAISADNLGVYSWKLDDVDFEGIEFSPDSSIAEGDVAEQVQYTNAKVLLVGESGAGKSALSVRLATGQWNPNTDSTLGAWATQWKLPVEQQSGMEREIWLWDFGGQSDQRIIHQLYMADAALAVLVFNGQKDDLFESIGQWDRDVDRASSDGLSKILVATRKDAGSLKFSRKQIDQFVRERRFCDFIETSAKSGEGCDQLTRAIVSGIAWDQIPWRSSPLVFKLLKERIVKLKEDGQILMRFNELRDRLRLEIGAGKRQFIDEELRAVLSLLTGPGVVAELEFGGWILFKPELINAYGQALIQTIRADPSELGCILEDKVLQGDMTYSARPEITAQDEQFILHAMHKQLVERGLCLRQQTDAGPMLVLPALYRRHRPEIQEHPPIVVSYDFDGFSDEIHATLVVHLIHTSHFRQDELWQDAADFKTVSGQQVGIRFSPLREGKGRVDVYTEPGLGIGQTIQFIAYVHEHLKHRARNVVRKRHYSCSTCGKPVKDLEAVAARLDLNKLDIPCVYCESRVQLWDELEKIYASKATVEVVRQLAERVDVVLDNESKERVLVGEVISAVALAGHICRELTVSDYGIDMEIEFKNTEKHPTGSKLYLQLKSGDSHLTVRAKDQAKLFAISNQRHVTYWISQKFPVFLVIRNSRGEITWMEIKEHLNELSSKGRKPVTQIVYKGEPFNVQSILSWQQRQATS
jgi:small GTP-binding protein